MHQNERFSIQILSIKLKKMVGFYFYIGTEKEKEQTSITGLSSSLFANVRKKKLITLPIFELILQSTESVATLLRAAILSRLATIYTHYGFVSLFSYSVSATKMCR
jgi:hypothetical protein